MIGLVCSLNVVVNSKEHLETKVSYSNRDRLQFNGQRSGSAV